jgi:hypothetical protein
MIGRLINTGFCPSWPLSSTKQALFDPIITQISRFGNFMPVNDNNDDRTYHFTPCACARGMVMFVYFIVQIFMHMFCMHDSRSSDLKNDAY